MSNDWRPPEPSAQAIVKYQSLHLIRSMCNNCNAKTVWWHPCYPETYCDEHVGAKKKANYIRDWKFTRYKLTTTLLIQAYPYLVRIFT